MVAGGEPVNDVTNVVDIDDEIASTTDCDVIESYATSDSDAEDLEQLMKDSREALNLTTRALDNAKSSAVRRSCTSPNITRIGSCYARVDVNDSSAVGIARQLRLVSICFIFNKVKYQLQSDLIREILYK